MERSRWTGPRVDTTADIAIVSHKDRKILLGRKKSDAEGAYRFIGGFADATKDYSFLDTAMRELKEEVLGLFPNEINRERFVFLESMHVKDIRYEGTPDRIITNLFIFDWDTYASKIPWGDGSSSADLIKAGDDLDQLEWFGLHEFIPFLLPQHKPLGLKVFEHIYYGNPHNR